MKKEWLESVHIGFLLVFVSYVMWVGMRGIDFHYPPNEGLERWVYVTSVDRFLETGDYFPTWYDYPSLYYHLALIVLVPDLFVCMFRGYTFSQTRAFLLGVVRSWPYLLRLRCVNVILSSMSLIWVYCLVLVWRKNRMEAFLAALFLGLSWEVNYHSRLYISDPGLMQFGALTMLCLAMSHFRPSKETFYLMCSSVVAGLACGTKYPGGALLFAILLATIYGRFQIRRHDGLWLATQISLLFLLTFFLTTPGALMQTKKFLADINRIRHLYATGANGYTVSAPLQHVYLMLSYFSLVLFSKFKILSLIGMAMSSIGITSIFREKSRFGYLYFCFPIIYFTCFSFQAVMVARNLLVLAPFLGVFAARGALKVYDSLCHGTLSRCVFFFSLFLFSLTNSHWLLWASGTIRETDTHRFDSELVEYFGKHKESEFSLSEKVATELKNSGILLPNNCFENLRLTADYGVFFSDEIPWRRYLANRYNYAEVWFGPYESNFNYYPFLFNARLKKIIVMKREWLKTLLD